MRPCLNCDTSFDTSGTYNGNYCEECRDEMVATGPKQDNGGAPTYTEIVESPALPAGIDAQ